MVAVLSGILSALSLPAAFVTPWGTTPLPDLGWFAWFALIPLYRSISQARPLSAFLKGFIFGTVHFGLTLYWIVIATHRYGDVSLLGSFLALAVGVALMALFPGAAAWGAAFLKKRGVPFGVIWIPLTIALEFLRNDIPFGGFPWSNLAYSQRSFATLLQVLDVTGIHGLLLLILLANVALAEIRQRKAWAIGFVVLLAGALTYGHFRLEAMERDTAARPALRVGIVQGNIPQEEKWVSEKIEEIIAHHVALTEKVEEGSDLLFWPEAAFPAVMPPEVTQIRELKDLKVPLLMGIVRYEGVLPDEGSSLKDTFWLFNSAILVKPEGEIEDRYDKVHLVPMGEYVPLEKFVSFLAPIVPAMSSFTPGRGFHLLSLTPGPSPGRGRGELQEEADKMRVRVQFGVTICYEDLFPEIARSFTRQGADFLVNLTNDGWYDRSSAVFQHFDFSRYRAVENRRAMVRVTNTGVTAVFSPTGEVLASIPPFEEATLQAKVPLGGPGSLYTQWGDWLPWGCVAGLILIIIKSFVRRFHVERNPRTS